MVLGGDVIRLFHGDEALTISVPDSDEGNAAFAVPPGAANGAGAPGSPPNYVGGKRVSTASNAYMGAVDTSVG